jgi:2Fe-2S ferredoxin
MPTITVLPINKVLVCEKGDILLAVLKNHGVVVQTKCGGVASCADCIVKIVSGEKNISAPDFRETRLIGNVFFMTKERLSCQTKVLGDIVVHLDRHSELN